jgi:hypothetical protein
LFVLQPPNQPLSFKQSKFRNPSASSDSASTEVRSENVFERPFCEGEEKNPGPIENDGLGPPSSQALTLDLTMNTSGAVMEAINSSGTGGTKGKLSKYLAP